jgi:Cysteine-rich CWC
MTDDPFDINVPHRTPINEVNTAPQSICPLCHRLNHCDVSPASGRCWCFDVQIPASLLAKVPEDLRNTACICRDCIVAFNTASTQDVANSRRIPHLP